MLLNNPVHIGSRLIPTVTINGVEIGIDYANRNGQEGRTRYSWSVDIGKQEYTGDDLQSGCQGGYLQAGMVSLLSFLSAAGESYPDGENSGLFSAELSEWCSENSEELSILAYELEFFYWYIVKTTNEIKIVTRT